MRQELWSETEARAVLEAWRTSGLPLARFARKHGWTPDKLYWWKRRLDVKRIAKPNVALLPVHISEPKQSEHITVLLRGGHAVKVSRGFDEDVFTRCRL